MQIFHHMQKVMAAAAGVIILMLGVPTTAEAHSYSQGNVGQHGPAAVQCFWSYGSNNAESALVITPSISAAPGYASQYVAWRAVAWDWNGEAWSGPYTLVDWRTEVRQANTIVIGGGVRVNVARTFHHVRADYL